MPSSPSLVVLPIALSDLRRPPGARPLGSCFRCPVVAFFANVTPAAHAGLGHSEGLLRSWLFGIVRTGMLRLTVDTHLKGTFRFVEWCRQRCSIWPMVAL